MQAAQLVIVQCLLNTVNEVKSMANYYHKLERKVRLITKDKDAFESLVLEVLDDLYDEIARLRDEVGKQRTHDENESIKLREIERDLKR